MALFPAGVVIIFLVFILFFSYFSIKHRNPLLSLLVGFCWLLAGVFMLLYGVPVPKQTTVLADAKEVFIYKELGENETTPLLLQKNITSTSISTTEYAPYKDSITNTIGSIFIILFLYFIGLGIERGIWGG